MRNLITDVPGVLVGAADNARLASGVSVVLCPVASRTVTLPSMMHTVSSMS